MNYYNIDLKDMDNAHFLIGLLNAMMNNFQTVGEENGNPFQYPCLENLMDTGAWWAAVPGVTKSWVRLSD